MHDGVLVVADPEVVNDHSANLPGRMTVMSIRHDGTDDTDGDYCGNCDVVGDDYRDNEGIFMFINNRHDYDAVGI